MSARPVVLILIGAFWPGSESTGPNQSIRGLCEALGDTFDFRIVARDRPFGDDRALADATNWHDLGYAKVRYLPVGRAGARGLARLLRATPHDILHLNGFFDWEFSIPALLARRAGRIPRRAVVLSPRGEFSSGALGLKAGVKRAYLALAQRTGLLAGVTLHTTSAAEDVDVATALPRQPRALAGNVRALPALPTPVPRPPGSALRLAFVGRISPVKGVDTALDALTAVTVPVTYDLYGPISDAAYWAECQKIIARLPTHIRVTAAGEVGNAEIVPLLARYDGLLLPSRSENFGHAIFEALAAGTPVVIGNRTPWRDLAAALAGYDVDLVKRGALTGAIEALAAADAGWRVGARALVERYVANTTAVADSRALYGKLLAFDLDQGKGAAVEGGKGTT